MKSFIAATILAFTASSIAVPTTSNLKLAKRQSTCNGDPGPIGVLQAIESWQNDVSLVNKFLDSFDASGIPPSLNPDQLHIVAQVTLDFANDEPNQLGVLSCVPAVASQDATQIDDLKADFGQVPLNLQNIVNNPSDPQNVATAIGNINHVRCCNVLPDLDHLWVDSANAEGVNFINTIVPRPTACASITC